MAQIDSGTSAKIKIDQNENYTAALAVLASLFFIWAVVTNVNDILIPHLKKALNLTDFQSSLVQSFFFGAYFVMSIPAGAILKRVGYKWGIIIGLGLMFIGALLFIPAALSRVYAVFLFALFVVGSGITLLQVAANPYVALLGNPNSASSRLNFTQAINSLGASIGPVLGGLLIFSGIEYSAAQWMALTPDQQLAYQVSEAKSVILPYVGLAVVLFLIALLIYYSNLPEIESSEEEEVNHHLLNDRKTSVWQYSHLTFGTLAIFLYVGAEVAIGSFIIRFAKLPHIASLGEKEAAFYVGGYMFCAMIGRFLGAAILTKVNPRIWLGINALIAVGLLAFVITGSGQAALWAIMSIGFFNSTMFPTIFTLGIKELGRFTKEGSSFLIMAIVGGAVITPIMGLVSDAAGSIQVAFLIPLVCYLYIVFYGFVGSKVKNSTISN
ncbi:MAG: L-fucose:H+ symporter permease [Bacteroidota bacterium]|nr:L-fucose:H+ symporter permease [Bacteroidota bacterium]